MAWFALGVATLLGLIIRFRARRMGWIIFAIAAVITAIWYQSIVPSHQRIWATDVAQTLKARVTGDTVSLSNVRNFKWRDERTAFESWESRDYDLSKLASVDMVTSVWDNPDIAHLMVSFGFEDGEQIVFSVETRKEAHENFSALGGFFRQFEMVLVAATEEDIIKLRTNFRKEDVRLYSIALNPQQRRDLFMSYVELAQDLEREPRFYNTLTANCTTTVYKLAQIVKPGMRADWKILLSGHLPSFVDNLGGFSEDMPIHERMSKAAITEKAQAFTGSNYSQGIRE